MTMDEFVKHYGTHTPSLLIAQADAKNVELANQLVALARDLESALQDFAETACIPGVR